MADLRISLPTVNIGRLRAPEPQVRATDAVLLQDIAGRATTKALRPTVVLQGEYDREDFRGVPLTDWVAGAVAVPGFMSRWTVNTLATHYINSTRTVEYSTLDENRSRDPERFSVAVPDSPADDDRWLRRWSPVGQPNYRALSFEAHDPNEGNVDVKVRFRFWAPRNFGGNYDQLSNRLMLLVHAGGTDGVVTGYALRDNWVGAPRRFEFVKFFGVPEDVILDVGTYERATRFSATTYRSYWSGGAGSMRVRTRAPSSRGILTRPRKVGKRLYAAGVANTAYARGDANVATLRSGFGEFFDNGTPSVDLVNIPNWTPSRTDLEPTWLWARVQTRSRPDGSVTLTGKVWGGDEQDEPALWQMSVVDDSLLSLGSGWTGIGHTTTLNPQQGLETNAIQDNGDFDLDSIQVTVQTQVPLGTNCSIKADYAELVIGAREPTFVVPNGRYVSTAFDTSTLGSLPTNWIVPRSANGPAVEGGTQVLPGDDARNWVVIQDPELDPAKYSDLTNRSVEHSSFDRSAYQQSDPADVETRILDPYMTRDMLAWNEPFPGSSQFGHDGQVDDAEVLTKFRADTKANSFSLWLRASGLKGYENGYLVTCINELDEGTWQIQKYVDGELGELTTFRAPWLTQEWFRMRVRITGASDRSAGNLASVPARYLDPLSIDPTLSVGRGGVRLQVKVWLEGDLEPTEWTSDFLDKGVNQGFSQGGFSGLPTWRAIPTRRDYAALFTNGPKADFGRGDGPRYVKVHDRGYIGWGSASIGSRQNVAEFHVHSLATPVRNFPALDKRNRASLALALSMDPAQWTARTANTVVFTTSQGQIGATDNVLITATELTPYIAGTSSNYEATLVAYSALIESVERVDVSAASRISVLATSHYLGTVQQPGTAGLVEGYNFNQDKQTFIGLRFYDAGGVSLGDFFEEWTYGGQITNPPTSADFRIGRSVPISEGVDSVGRLIRAGGMSMSKPVGAVTVAVLVMGFAGVQTAQNASFGGANLPRGDQWAVGKVGVFFSDDVVRYYDTQPGEWVAPFPQDYVPDNDVAALAPGVAVRVSLEAPVATLSLSLPMPTESATRPQYTRPVLDTSRGTWTRHDNATTGLYDALDETQPSDADYIQSAHKPVADRFDARLASITNPDPDGTSGYFVHYRYRRRGSGAATLRTVLLQGTTEVASWTDSGFDNEYVTAKRPLTPAQIAAITDYSDLRVALVGDVIT